MTRTQEARIKKTRSYFEQRDEFMETLYKEIKLFTKRAHKSAMWPCVRLNGTSDIPWERVPVNGSPNLMDAFPEVQFYDYTKRCNRRDIPANYHLTFSLAEDNHDRAREAFINGMNVAIVYRHETLPEYDAITIDAPRVMLTVHNGFETDLRFLDPSGVIVGLCAKGKGRYDTTGFVR